MTHLPFDPDVAGVDEAGRGPLAGPLVVAAVLLPHNFDPQGLDDSKKIPAHRRDHLFFRIVAQALYSIVIVPPTEIDRLNILQATLQAMGQALRQLPERPRSALVDGDKPPIGAPCPCLTLIKGDSKNAAIAAASVLAKVTRDRLMVQADTAFPGYGFAEHFGYYTPAHVQAIRGQGPSPLHRKSFEPVKSLTLQSTLPLEL